LRATAALLIAVVALVALAPPTLGQVNTTESTDFTLVDPTGRVTARFYNMDAYSDSKTQEVLQSLGAGTPVVFYGEGAELLLEIAEPRIALTGGDAPIVVGVWLQGGDAEAPVSVLVVTDANYEEISLEEAIAWAGEPLTVPTVAQRQLYSLVGAVTEVDRRLPLGVLTSKTEIVRVSDSSAEYDWYDVTVTQTLTPGAHLGASGWRWSQLTYTMDGSPPGANVELTSYDAVTENPEPRGLFTFLLRIMTFRWSSLLPWLWGRDQGTTWTDNSDYARSLYAVRYEAPEGSDDAAAPLDARHHYAVKTAEAAAPTMSVWTHVTYIKGGALSAERYTTPPMGGTLTINP
jgi:hypothetical protein